MMVDPAGSKSTADRNFLSFAAPAKVNLYLHATGSRADGYHLLDSLIAFAGIHDTLALSPADDVSLSVEGPFAGDLPANAENLVIKAAVRLGKVSGITAGAHMRLEKRLPVAAGIGGGSADAAAALRGLARLWDIDGETAGLENLALALGADVPVCLGGYASFVGGIGEEITRAPLLPPAWLVLANPGVSLSTADVFAARRGDFSRPDPFDESPATARMLAELLGTRRNDLTEAAVGLQPVIGDVLTALDALGGCLLARLSGSGATCFGLFAQAGAAAEAAAVLGRDHPNWWVRAAPLLDDAGTLKG